MEKIENLAKGTFFKKRKEQKRLSLKKITAE